MLPSPPKTLTLSTPTIRNQRTLIWLQHQSSSIPWWKWDGVVSSLDDYRRWSAQGATLVGVVLCEHVKESEEKWLEEVYHIAKKVQFVMLPRCVIQWKSEEYWRENFDNVFQLEEIHESYPFVGGVWDGTVEDAIHLLALLSRYHRIIDVPPTIRPSNGRIIEQGSRPPEFVLFTQFYISSSKKRTQELRECLRRNTKCRWIDRIVLLNEKDESIAWASFLPRDTVKIEQHIVGRRLTYADFFKEVIRRYPNANANGVDTVVALANADIYFGDELAEVWRIQWEDRAVCLLRWDDLGTGPSGARLFGPRADSQDVWMFSATSVANRRWPWNMMNIPLGKPGCDNAILYPLLQQRFLLSNPALSLKTYHLHNSGVRSYNHKEAIPSPVYIHLEPTYLVDTKQEFTPKEAPQYICNEVVSFTVRSSSMSNEITYCTMLEKEGRYRWEPTVENCYFEPAIPIYRWKQTGGAGVTPNGLVYDLFHIYTGRAAIQQSGYNYWPSAGVDIFTPLISCKRMAAIPLPHAPVIFEDIHSYLLFYLSRYMRIQSIYPVEDCLGFWMPPSGLGDVPSDVKWRSHGVPWEKGMACWADEVVGYLPGPSMSELGREDVMMLRTLYHEWSSAPVLHSVSQEQQGRTCIVVGDEYLTTEWVQQLGEVLPSSWHIQLVRPGEEKEWFGASMCILVGGPDTMAKWTPLWRLPQGAVLLEFQQELSVSGECQHIAHVADLSSWIMLLSKDSVKGVQEAILSGVKGWWMKHYKTLFGSAPATSVTSPSRSLPHS